jgi:hypothetical protein
MSQPLKSNHVLARTAPLDRVNDQKAQRFAALFLLAHLFLICVTRMELSCISLFRLMRVRISCMTKQSIHEQLTNKGGRLFVRKLTNGFDRPHFSVTKRQIHTLITDVFRVRVHGSLWLVSGGRGASLLLGFGQLRPDKTPIVRAKITTIYRAMRCNFYGQTVLNWNGPYSAAPLIYNGRRYANSLCQRGLTFCHLASQCDCFFVAHAISLALLSNKRKPC